MDGLEEVLRSQIKAVDRRVQRGGNVYAQEREEVRRAAEAVPRLRADLGLGQFTRSLTPATGKPQFLLEFDMEFDSPGDGSDPEDGDRSRVVLKVYGRSRPGEGALQHAWCRRGIRSAFVLRYGDQPISWLLMRAMQGSPLSAEDVAGPGLSALTREVACLMREAWEADPGVIARTRPVVAAVGQHLDVVLGVLERHRYRLPPQCREHAADIYRRGRSVHLHGDLCLGNLLRHRADGRLWMVDACAYLGDPAFDAARWCARTGGPGRAMDAARAWREVAGEHDASLLEAMVGVELLMEAGVHEIVKDERGLPAGNRDEHTLACLARSQELLSA